MAKDQKVLFRKLLQYRIRLHREAREFTRKEMATVLDVFEDTYKKWEIGSGGTMPSFYYVKFCTIVKADINEFLTPMPNEDEQIAMYASETSIMEDPEVKRSGNSHDLEFEDSDSGEIVAA